MRPLVLEMHIKIGQEIIAQNLDTLGKKTSYVPEVFVKLICT